MLSKPARFNALIVRTGGIENVCGNSALLNTLGHYHLDLLMMTFAHMRTDILRVGGDDIASLDGITERLGLFVLDVGEFQQFLARLWARSTMWM